MNNLQTITNEITATNVDVADRLDMLPRYFNRFFLQIESAVYNQLKNLCDDYSGAYWEFVELSNGGFFMYPKLDGTLNITVIENYFSGEMTPEAAGITACLFIYSRFSFLEQDESDLVDFAALFHNLRDFALDHDEAGLILSAID